MFRILRLRQLVTAIFASVFLLVPFTGRAQTPVVYGVFFFLPTCSHCHVVMTEHWPGIQEEFGDQLRVMFVDASTEEGSRIMMNALATLNIDSNGVPMLIIGTHVLIGEAEIPQRAPEIIRTGLASGGIELPAIPRIDTIYEDAVSQPNGAAGVTVSGVNASFLQPQVSVFERFISDPVANTLAVVVLGLLAFSLYAAFTMFWRKPAPKGKPAGRDYAQLKQNALLLIVGLGIIMTLSLLLGNNDSPKVLLLAVGEVAVFLVIGGALLRARDGKTLPNWLVPLIAVAGIAVAGYLAYVELTASDAVCGVVGNCNTVQESAYARIFNVPIGVLGIVGYVLILAAWLLRSVPRFQPWADDAVRGMVLFGVVFSIYLTFLEPFVIGASCMWCLTSAVIMLLLLWLLAPTPRPATVATPVKRKLRTG